MNRKLRCLFPILVVVFLFGAAPAPNLLGVTVQSSRKFNIGVDVTAVSPDSPCKSVLTSTDVIVELNPAGDLTGNRSRDQAFLVDNLDQFNALAGQLKPGATATLMLYSNQSTFNRGRKVTCAIPADAVLPAPAAAPAAGPAEGGNILGITVDHPTRGFGVQIKSVAPDSPCASVLKPGGIIYNLNPNGNLMMMRGPDTKFATYGIEQFDALVKQIQPGSNVTLNIDTKKVTCQVPANAPAVPAGAGATAPTGAAPAAGASSGAATGAVAGNILGITVEAVSGNTKGGGVKVTAVAPDSPCKAALKPGDVIYVMNPKGKAGVFNSPESPLMVNDLSDFQFLVSQVKPGATVGFVTSSGSIKSCQIPAAAPAQP